MFLTTKGRYAVMALVDVALNSVDTPITLADISERQGITIHYLEQIFSKLRKAGVVSSVRGPGGGYRFSRSSESITILEIVDAVEESIKMTRCDVEKSGCMHDKGKCLTHHLWDGLGRQIESYLSAISLEDVSSGKVRKNNIELFAIQQVEAA